MTEHCVILSLGRLLSQGYMGLLDGDFDQERISHLEWKQYTFCQGSNQVLLTIEASVSLVFPLSPSPRVFGPIIAVGWISALTYQATVLTLRHVRMAWSDSPLLLARLILICKITITY